MRMVSLRRLLVAGVVAIAAGASAIPAQAAAPPAPSSGWASASGHPHLMPRKGAPNASAPSTRVGAALTRGSGPLIYANGNIQTQPTLYLDFWGSDWQGTTPDAGGYTPAQAVSYIEAFVNGLAGSAYLHPQTQYCLGVVAAQTSAACSATAPHVGNTGTVPTGHIWMDPVAVPTTPTDTDIVNETDDAAAHFGLSQVVNAAIIVMSPSGKSSFSDASGSFCAFHDFTNTAIYAYIPYEPDQGANCFTNAVNASNDTFGHGHFDGFSIAIGHEIAETITDPQPAGVNSAGQETFGWIDQSLFETADKCENLASFPPRNLTLGGTPFAVQPNWSDFGSGCVMDGVGGFSSSHAAVAAQDAGSRDVFVRGSDGALWEKSLAGAGWGDWQSLGGGIIGAPAAVSWGSGRVDVFARGLDNALWHRGWVGSTWSPWQSLGGGLTSAPTVASWAAGRLDVFVVGTDKGLWHKAWDGAQWSAWEPQGGLLTADPGAVSWSANRIDVFDRGSDNAMWWKFWDGAQWSSWQPLGGGFTNGVTAASTGAGQVEVLSIGQDGAVWRKSFSGSWSGWTSLEGSWNQAPAAISPHGTGQVDLVMVGQDGQTVRLEPGL